MALAPTNTSGGAPLLSQLAQLGFAAERQSKATLADTLADLIDLSDSITLTKSLAKLARVKTEFGAGDRRSAESEFLNTRAGILRFIQESFEPGDAGAPFLLPAATAETLTSASEGMQPYQRFYSLHQSEMDFRIGKLRGALRKVLSGHNLAGARLAALDQILNDTMGDHSRRILATLPRLLGQHFKALRQDFVGSRDDAIDSDPNSWTQPGEWLDRFNQDMRHLLVTELDFRLLPLRGLLDALDTQEDRLL